MGNKKALKLMKNKNNIILCGYLLEKTDNLIITWYY